ncbi:DUF305 domain-containing protein [Nodularia spumigena CS-584]|jgi:uncharacterized protein (DUF305 family)|uniref:DUF305 domain-containing protein n=1 Tax=Nodularia spumigena UHCC 0060 TaxID=3110300 RepID=A0ABU5UPI1_NODSP|nr:DUF305 domain-containing protein [Nodularia spumigena]AHJ28936.1 hypothetical protein NSP_26080 [Nodularia spumigena CCY9414]EAW45363.1 hypothetical protein N9414_20565 [Nodularia spumigena CCY9414]MDB9382846.1 DUF305 domain-containing protein [Nodularia spumigena CS-584]MEA5525263.1 DUF305 domain-containing protein [Nodularia spumigena UHCC 0143]MEA5557016.1 DUF305 domain-containing protein [Nodularia spumigena CH309]
MQILSVKNKFLALSFVVLTSLSGGVLTACSTTSSENANNPNTTVTETSDSQQMQHGGMNHSMDLGPADASYDLRFIDGMIVHHQGAVVMAQEAQEKSQRPEIKELADEIIKAQNQEIAQMQQWRSAWYPNAGDKAMAHHGEMGNMMEMTPEQKQAMMMSMDLGAADAEFDLRFINGMIPHHEGALVMAQDVLQKSQRREMKKLAEEIIQAQETEINQMKQWRQAWYQK